MQPKRDEEVCRKAREDRLQLRLVLQSSGLDHLRGKLCAHCERDAFRLFYLLHLSSRCQVVDDSLEQDELAI